MAHKIEKLLVELAGNPPSRMLSKAVHENAYHWTYSSAKPPEVGARRGCSSAKPPEVGARRGCKEHALENL